LLVELGVVEQRYQAVLEVLGGAAVTVLPLYLTPIDLPVLAITSDAALIFYGSSMLLAAVRGYRGCELLAVSNWVLGRDDQIGCVVFSPVDHLERRLNRGKVINPDG